MSGVLQWAEHWQGRLAAQPEPDTERRRRMRDLNPAYIPRNHRVQQVIDAATDDGELRPLERLLRIVSQPYQDHPDDLDYRQPPKDDEVVRQTFCGT